MITDRDFAFLHGFQQSRLHFRTGAVDLVGQEQVGKHRPFMDPKLADF